MKAVFTGIMLLAMIAGVFFAPYFGISSIGLIALFGIFFLVSLSFLPQKWLWISMIAIGFFFLGVLRFQTHEAGLNRITYPTKEKVAIKGQIVEPPEDTKKATKVVLKDEVTEGRVLLILKPFSGLKYGDYIGAEGEVVKPETEELKNQLFVKGITHEMLFPQVSRLESGGLSLDLRAKSVLYGIRNKFEESINAIFPEPESSFLAGLLLGLKRNLPEWLMEDLQKSGTSHLIALSGFNITVIIEGLRIIFRKKSQRLSFFVPLAAILGFVVMTGSQSSVVRAGIMGTMVLLAHRIGRQSSAAMAIILTAFLMVAINPLVLRFDVGFQLSFAAFMGIIYLGPLIREVLPLKVESIKEILSMTLGAQLMAYPLILYYFGTFSLVSLLTNLVTLPFIPIVMLLGFVAATVGVFSHYIGFVLSFVVLFALKAIISVIHFSANLPLSSFEDIDFSGSNMVFLYIVIFELAVIYRSVKRKKVLGKGK